MRLKIFSKLIAPAFLSGFFLFLIVVFCAVLKSPTQSIAKSVIQQPVYEKRQETVAAGLPVRLMIPKIKTDTALEQVGLTSQGAIDVPKGPINAAWFKLGPRPGDSGSAVITGHYGIWKNGTPTVFNNLYKLRKGDKIFIKDDKGKIISFAVREIKRYDQNADASEIFGSSDEGSHLNLITCEGTWNKVSKSYPKRLVVFADKEVN
jgi:LPXTG-site transpeptidase (sortase) family protein